MPIPHAKPVERIDVRPRDPKGDRSIFRGRLGRIGNGRADAVPILPHSRGNNDSPFTRSLLHISQTVVNMDLSPLNSSGQAHFSA